jgi:hypothetical protein
MGLTRLAFVCALLLALGVRADSQSYVSGLRLGTIVDGECVKRVGDALESVACGGGAAWGGITGTLSAQTDLQTALDGKEPAGVAFSELSGTATDAQIPDTITISLAAAATALAADPADCATATHFAVGVVASGAATCEAIADADVPDTITLSNLTQITTRAISDTTGTLAVARGGTNLTASADDNLMVGNATTWETKALPSCSNGTTDKLLYNISTNAFSCGVDQTAGGGPTTLTASADASDAVVATLTAIPGIAFTPAASTKYLIDCYIIYTSTATTTGISFAWDTPASPTRILMSGYTPINANTGGTFHQRADNTNVGITTATQAVGPAEFLAILNTLFENGTNSTSMTLGFTPETANSVTVKAGSICQYRTY